MIRATLTAALVGLATFFFLYGTLAGMATYPGGDHGPSEPFSGSPSLHPFTFMVALGVALVVAVVCFEARRGSWGK